MSPAQEPAGPTPLEQALAIAAAGLRVLPIRPGTRHPPMREWQNHASTDPERIRKWWNGLYRDHGVGIAMGHQPDGRNTFAVDVDRHNPDDDGYETLAQLEQQHGKLPDTVRSLTPRDGTHLIFDSGDLVVTNGAAGLLGPGIDLRGAGGQVVAHPSIHPMTGTRYQWEAGCAPWETEIARAPDWLLELVQPSAGTCPCCGSTRTVM